ncbi:MAG: peptidoglycan-binding domain-containing protein [Bacteroidota bacterium]
MAEILSSIGLNSKGPQVKALHGCLRLTGFTLPLQQMAAMEFGIETRDALLDFQKKTGLPVTGAVDEATRARLAIEARRNANKCIITGRIVYNAGTSASKVKLKFYQHLLGSEPAARNETITDSKGYYQVEFNPTTGQKKAASINIEVRMIQQGSKDEKEIPVTAVLHNISPYEVLNLVAPFFSDTVSSEYDRLTGSVAEVIGNVSPTTLVENAERHDISIFAHQTGWDARLVAWLVLAHRMAEELKLDAEALYGIFRCGVPYTKERLALVPIENVQRALVVAIEKRIIDISDAAIKRTLTALAGFRKKIRFGIVSPNHLSSPDELLALSQLNDDEKNEFRQIINTQELTDTIWNLLFKKLEGSDTARQKKIAELQLHSDLASLTHSNLPLIRNLLRRINDTGDVSVLIAAGLYEPNVWSENIKSLVTNNRRLEDLIPNVFRSESVQERLREYSKLLATRIRRRFPVHVLRQQIKDERLVLGKDHSLVKDFVVQFLEKATTLGYVIGVTPFGQFLNDNQKALTVDSLPTNVVREFAAVEQKQLKEISAASFINRNFKQSFTGLGTKAMNESRTKIISALRTKRLTQGTIESFLTSAPPAGLRGSLVNEFERFRTNVSDVFDKQSTKMKEDADKRLAQKGLEAIKTLIRLYQVAPTDESLQILYDLELNSARAIALYSVAGFVESYKRAWQAYHKKASPADIAEAGAQAEWLYNKAWSIHSTTMNLVVTTQLTRNSSIYALSGEKGE